MPDFFDEVLGRVVRREVDAGDGPRRWVESAIDLLQEGGHLRPLVPAGIVPTDGLLGVGIARLQLDQEIRRIVALRVGIRHQVHLAGAGIPRAIKGLAGLGIAHIQRQPFVPLAPPIAADLPLVQKTCIEEEQHPHALVEVVLMRRHIRAHFHVLGWHVGVVFLGLLAWTFFQLMPAAWSKS